MEKELNYNIAIFIISNKRPQCTTVNTLLESGYTGNWYILLDNTDTTVDEYLTLYEKSNILIFDKEKFHSTTDTGVVNAPYTSAVYARNAVEYIAKQMGLDYFIIMDDDISNFRYRYLEDSKTKSLKVYDFDSVIEYYINFMESNSSLSWLCLANTFMFKGGFDESTLSNLRRGSVVFFRKVSNQIEWKSFINEDTITSLLQSKYGQLGFILPFVQEDNAPMNSLSGGNKEYYDATSSFNRVCYALIMCPDIVRPIPAKHKITIGTNSVNSFPKLVSSRYKK